MHSSKSVEVVLLPMFADNYLFLIVCGSDVIAIDPGDPEVVETYLGQTGFRLRAVLSTHHHADHTGGNLRLQEQFGCEIYGCAADRRRIPGATQLVQPEQSFTVCGLDFHVIDVSGHTIGHIAYYLPASHQLYVGDALFSLGCGRLFEGSPRQMHRSLQRIADLPNETLVYAAHEYTVDNGKFALGVDQGNRDLQRFLATAIELRELGEPTIPFQLGMQKLCNPFLRVHDRAIQQEFATVGDDVQTFAALRAAKDHA